MDKQTSFWVGGLTSTTAYALLIFFIFYQLSHQPKKIAMMSDGGMQISVDIAEPKPLVEPTPPPLPMPVQPQPEPKPDEFAEQKKVVKKPEPPKPVEEKKEKPIDTKQLMKLLPQPTKEQPKTKTESKPVDAKSIVNSLDLKKNSLNVSFNSSGEFDAYLNKIAQIIRAGWNPYSTDAGLVATINININPDGSFTFKLKTASNNPDFNSRLNEYLKSLQLKNLPPPDNHKSVNVDFNFKATQ